MIFDSLRDLLNSPSDSRSNLAESDSRGDKPWKFDSFLSYGYEYIMVIKSFLFSIIIEITSPIIFKI